MFTQHGIHTGLIFRNINYKHLPEAHHSPRMNASYWKNSVYLDVKLTQTYKQKLSLQNCKRHDNNRRAQTFMLQKQRHLPGKQVTTHTILTNKCLHIEENNKKTKQEKYYPLICFNVTGLH